jgi:hypothetical protein
MPEAVSNIFNNCKLQWGDPIQIFAMKRYEEWCLIQDLLAQLESLPVFGYHDECPICGESPK